MGSFILGLLRKEQRMRHVLSANPMGSARSVSSAQDKHVSAPRQKIRHFDPTAFPALLTSGTAIALTRPSMFYTFRFARSLLAAASIGLFVGACTTVDPSRLSQQERAAIADSIKHIVVAAYDLTKPDVVGSMMSLYPTTGRVISASVGSVTTNRRDLQAQIASFWERVGKNMKSPKWEWTSMNFDILSRTSAVMTATYRVPHLTPTGQPHVIGGAWTAVFQLQSGRWVIVQEHLSDSPTP